MDLAFPKRVENLTYRGNQKGEVYFEMPTK